MSVLERPQRTLLLKSKSLPVIVGMLVLVQLLFPDRSWMVLLSGFGGAWLLGYLWARSLKDGLHLERDMRFGWMQVGDRLQEQVSLENKGWAPALWVRVNDHSDMENYEISRVASVQGRWYSNWYSRGICQRRGLFTFGPTSLETGDPFGLYRVRIEYGSSANMMVAPQVVSLPEVEIAAGGRAGEGRSSSRGMEPTVTAGGVREYLPGDSQRWVHWPTTARKGEPYVQVYDTEPSSDWWVVLDIEKEVQFGEGRDSTEEVGVILAASIVNRGLQGNKSVGLISQGRDLCWHPPERGDSQLYAVLRSLASLRPGRTPLGAVLDRIRGSIGQQNSLVVITSNLSLEWLNGLELLQRGGIVPTVILLDPNTFGGSGDIQALQDHLASMGVIHYVFTSDFLEPIDDTTDSARDWWPLYHSRVEAARRTKWFGFGFWPELRNMILILLLFLGLVSTVGKGVRGVESSLLWYVIGSGMLAGWSLARLPLSVWLLIPLNLVLGAVLTLVEVVRLGDELKLLISESLEVLAGTYRWLVQQTGPPDLTPLMGILGEVWSSISLLVNRLWMWVAAVIEGNPFFDPMAVVMFWGVLVWCTAAWAMWWIYKRSKPFLGSIPVLTLGAIMLAFTGQFAYGLVLMLGSTLALIIFINHDLRERFWERKDLFPYASVWRRVVTAGTGLAIGLMLFSSATSLISIRPFVDFIFDGSRAETGDVETARSFGFDPQERPQKPSPLRSGMQVDLPNEHLLGSGPELSDQVVMLLSIEGMTVVGDPDEYPLIPLRYVRSLTYDRYTGPGWVTREVQFIDYQPGEQLFPWVDEHQQVLRQRITIEKESLSYLYTVGIPLSVDHDFSIAWRLMPEVPPRYDLFGGSVDTKQYRADSLVPIFNENLLREAGQDYPDWIRERYIVLPASIPERVLTLARDLTATEPTPYDRAVALEGYLRSFPYTLDVPKPPRDQDVSDYFLFTLQKGYCDYYATSMVVLARSAGIPARLVTGYIAEYYDPETQAYIITADQAHTWVEVYFPGYGWMPFEPTAGREEIARGEASLPGELPELDISLQPLIQKSSQTISLWARRIGSSLAATLAAALIGILMWEVAFLRQPVSRLLPAIFARLYRFGRYIGVETRPGTTLQRFIGQLVRRMNSLSRTSRVEGYVRARQKHLDGLAWIYQNYLFGRLTKADGQPQQVRTDYRKLRPLFLLFWVLVCAYRFPFLRSLIWKEPPGEDSFPDDQFA